jgi:hypothetical protein
MQTQGDFKMKSILLAGVVIFMAACMDDLGPFDGDGGIEDAGSTDSEVMTIKDCQEDISEFMYNSMQLFPCEYRYGDEYTACVNKFYTCISGCENTCSQQALLSLYECGKQGTSTNELVRCGGSYCNLISKCDSVDPINLEIYSKLSCSPVVPE